MTREPPQREASSRFSWRMRWSTPCHGTQGHHGDGGATLGSYSRGHTAVPPRLHDLHRCTWPRGPLQPPPHCRRAARHAAPSRMHGTRAQSRKAIPHFQPGIIRTSPRTEAAPLRYCLLQSKTNTPWCHGTPSMRRCHAPLPCRSTAPTYEWLPQDDMTLAQPALQVRMHAPLCHGASCRPVCPPPIEHTELPPRGSLTSHLAHRSFCTQEW